MNLYKTLEEKNNFFKQTTIETVSSLTDFMNGLSKKEKNIWRGHSHSGYKIFTSLQNAFLRGELGNISPYDYITNLNQRISNYNYGFLRKYFTSFGFTVEDPNLSFLSIARHYGAYSPMLDFSRDPMVSLYFATRNCSDSFSTETDNYFSIYLIKDTSPFDMRNCEGEIHELEIQAQIEEINLMLSRSGKTLPDEVKRWKAKERAFAVYPAFKLLTAYKETRPELKNNYSVFFIDDNEFCDLKFYLNVNANIVAQDGVFICNTFPDLPLEETFKKGIVRVHKEDEFKKQFVNPEIECFNINKKFSYSVNLHLIKLGYTDETIKPSFEKIVTKLQNDLLNDLK